MIAEHRTLELRTHGNDHILDITGDVQALVAETGVAMGQAVLLVHGSTAAVTTLEFEPGLVNHDIAAAMERLAPRDGRYVHEETWNDDNGHAHVRARHGGPRSGPPRRGRRHSPGHLAADRLHGLRHPPPKTHRPRERDRSLGRGRRCRLSGRQRMTR